MKTTRYFEEQVPSKRSYRRREWCQEVIADPLSQERQADGRYRFWREIKLGDERSPGVLRVVTLEDGETLHNAFFDRNDRKSQP